MSYVWKKNVCFEKSDGEGRIENWFFETPSKNEEFDVNVTFNKPIDILEYRENTSFRDELGIQKKVRRFFESDGRFVNISECPVCATSIKSAKKEARIWGADYYKCNACSHAYASPIPDSKSLEKFYSKSHQDVSSFYTEDDTIEAKIREVYSSKLEWIIQAYKDTYNRQPKSIVDLGAGAGHFLCAAKRKGISVYGIEPNKTLRQWCFDKFGISLSSSVDEIPNENIDIVCSFNAIEHMDPNHFIALCEGVASNGSIIAIETPNYNSFTSAIQKLYPNKISKHLVPYVHIQMYTESSLATLLYMKKYRVSHAWYFGHDIMECISVIADGLDVNGDSLISNVFPHMQNVLDQACLGNQILFTAVPKK